MKYGKYLTITKAIAIVENMRNWKEKHKNNKNVPPADYTSYAAALLLLKDNGFNGEINEL